VQFVDQLATVLKLVHEYLQLDIKLNSTMCGTARNIRIRKVKRREEKRREERK